MSGFPFNAVDPESGDLYRAASDERLSEAVDRLSDRLSISTPDSSTSQFTLNANGIVVPTLDMDGYESVSLQISNVGVTRLYPEWSNDQIEWHPGAFARERPAVDTGFLSELRVKGIWTAPRAAQFFRVRQDDYQGGQTTITVALMKSGGQRAIGGQVAVFGVAAEGGTSSSSPLISAGIVLDSTATFPAGTIVRDRSNLAGERLVSLDGPTALNWRYAATAGGITDTNPAQIVAAASAGYRNKLTRGSIKNAGATATEVQILDGAAVIWRSHVAAGERVPIDAPLRGSSATALHVKAVSATTLYVNAGGYQTP